VKEILAQGYRCKEIAHPIKSSAKSELNSFTYCICLYVAGFLEHESLLVKDDENDYLALDGSKDSPMLQIQGHPIINRNATGKQQGRKFFILQTISAVAEQGLASGCAVILPALGYQKMPSNNGLYQGALPTQNTLQ
jgi:hypothetical protein